MATTTVNEKGLPYLCIRAIVTILFDACILWLAWNAIAPDYEDILPVSMTHVPFLNWVMIIIIRNTLFPKK